ncbi:HNH endonuclease signature motif containing protein, partial [Knoellia sp. Soil729]|uniref:HNH endonuclease signature motif containing protein n=1 Tax=Knoellia sp. Soil729 TaxID=1736394 RepID=UPI001F4018C9
ADGMAWLSILGPVKDVIGAHVALTAEEKRRHVLDPDLPAQEWEAAAAAARADTRSRGAWLADRALELLSGRAKDQPQPVEVNLVMTDRVLLPAAFGGKAPADDVAVIPGWGVIPGADARAHIAALLDRAGDRASDAAADIGSGRDADGASDAAAFVWLRRLFTDPTGRNLVALDSVRRRFEGGLRRFLELRDPTCRVPWCDAPATQSDHARSHANGGPTDASNGQGLCQRHNLVKELNGWHVRVQSTGLDSTGAHGIRIQTPTGRIHDSTAPPILGEGWLEPVPDVHLQDLPLANDPWHGWIPDPPEDWLTRDELQVA